MDPTATRVPDGVVVRPKKCGEELVDDREYEGCHETQGVKEKSESEEREREGCVVEREGECGDGGDGGGANQWGDGYDGGVGHQKRETCWRENYDKRLETASDCGNDCEGSCVR